MRNILFITLCLTACITHEEMKSSAENNAWAFAEDMNLEATGVSCSARDSDNDGDVSCSLLITGEEPRAIECNYDVAWAPFGQARGCKLVVFARGFAPSEE